MESSCYNVYRLAGFLGRTHAFTGLPKCYMEKLIWCNLLANTNSQDVKHR